MLFYAEGLVERRSGSLIYSQSNGWP